MMMEQSADNKENNLFFNVTHNLMILGNYTEVGASAHNVIGKMLLHKGSQIISWE